MKILHVNPYPPEHMGGSEIFCKNLALNLSKFDNIQSDILTADYFGRAVKKTELNEDVNVIYKKYYYNIWSKNPLVNVYSFLKRNYQNYDIIHAHSYIFFTSLQVALFRKLRNFPYILHLHGGVQTSPHLKANLIEHFQLIIKKSLFDRFIGRFTVDKADAIISVSLKDLKFLQENFNISKPYLYHVPNGVSIEKFKFEENIKREYLTFIGRLTYVKGFDLFIRLIKKLYAKNHDLKFLIVGDGPLRKLVEDARKSLPITYYPHYPYNRMKNIYNQSKLLILTSRFEGVPTTILESLSCETPVISTNVGGISEIIQDGINGILLNDHHLSNKFSKIIDLINNDDQLKQYGIKGRDLIEKKYSWEHVTNQIINIYKQLL